MSKEETILIIDVLVFEGLGIDKEEVIEYIENKHAISIKPIHVKAYHFLKNQPAVTSS